MLLFGVLVLLTDLLRVRLGAVRHVDLFFLVLVAHTDFLTVGGEEQGFLGGVWALGGVLTGAGRVDLLLFPSLAKLGNRNITIGREDHFFYLLTLLVFTGALGLLDLLFLVTITVLFLDVGNVRTTVGGVLHVLRFLTLLLVTRAAIFQQNLLFLVTLTVLLIMDHGILLTVGGVLQVLDVNVLLVRARARVSLHIHVFVAFTELILRAVIG